MKTSFKIAIAVLVFLGVAALTTLYIANNTIAILEPKGAIGEKESDLLITSSLLMLIVVVPVLVLTWVFAWKYREGNKESTHHPDWEHNHIAECCWWGVPCVIIIILAVLTWESSHRLNPFRPIETGVRPIEIQAVALDWKWLFIYPEQGIATVNFVQFPENTPISFEITADAPMNSFWIPQLGGQIYAMPAMRSQLHLIANEEGTFRGCSANISGEGFAGMFFTAKASSSEEFDQWVEEVKQSPHQLTLDTYEELVKPTSYHPVEYFVLEREDLFDWILMQYMHPQHHVEESACLED
jgi:cytochrome o ubiquinol oxidase subunit 2